MRLPAERTTTVNGTRKYSAAAGVVFILTTIAGVLCLGNLGTMLAGPDFIRGVAAGSDRLAIAATLEAAMGLGCAGIALALYPVVRQTNPGLAIGSVGFRIVEGTLLLLVAACWTALATIGQDASTANSLDAASTRASADLLRTLAGQFGALANVPFCVGATLYYFAFWQSRQAPRWLTGWGIAAAIPYVAAGIYAFVGRTDVQTYTVLMIPMAVQEMVFAVWLIAKGVREPVASGRAVALAGAAA
jgi:hypothetical protein